jgi:processive 1,2-diacylglycerol beta-glucosyltransferase
MKKVVEFDPNLTISSHFFSSILMGSYKEKGITNSKIISIITDYTANELVLKNQKYDDAIVVADEMVKNILIDKGIDNNKIKVYGLPISDKRDLLNKDLIFSKYVLEKDKPIFLMFGGGNYGCTSYFNFFKKLADEAQNYQLIFTTGNNESFKNKCYKYIKLNKIKNVRVIGFIEEIENLINISDAIITNPNGTIVAECINLKKPLILIPGYGGVELKNEKYLLKKGYAKKVHTTFGLKKIINNIIDNPSMLEKIKFNLNKVNKNNPLDDLYKLINDLLK